MTRLQLAPGINLPLDFLLMRFGVLGTSGSGKSTFGRLYAEAIHAAGHRFCVIDTKSDWWGLKSSADGRSAGIPVVIFGGPRADIPLEVHAGAQVAEVVAELPHPVILDLGDLDPEDQCRFIGPFLKRLFRVNREPLGLLCDEADIYAPQKPMTKEELPSLKASDSIARRGRTRSLGSGWLVQRNAVITKNISYVWDAAVIFRTPGEGDQQELEGVIKRMASKEERTSIMDEVAGLANGEAVFLSRHPALKLCKVAQTPLPWTFDSSATPSVGKRRAEPKVLAKADLQALQQRMASAIERAQAEDPAHLRRRIAQLEAEARKAFMAPKAPPQPPPQPKVVEVLVVTAEDHRKLDQLVKRVEKAAAALDEDALALKHLGVKMGEVMRIQPTERGAAVAQLKAWGPPPTSMIAAASLEPPKPKAPPKPPKVPIVASPGHPGTLTNTQQRILDVIIALELRGIPTTRKAVARWQGIHFNGSRFQEDLSRLVAEGYLDGLKLTDRGMETAHTPERGVEAAVAAASLKDKTRGRVLRAILELNAEGAYPNRVELAEHLAVHHNGSRYAEALSWLRQMGLIPEEGPIKAVDGTYR